MSAESKELTHAPAAVLRSEAAKVVAEKTHGISQPCSTRFRAVHHSGQRPLSAIKWVVLHSTEGDTALGAAAWFANPRSQGSAHLCVDDNYCFQTLDEKLIPWAAPGANTQGFHIEQAGYAKWTNLIWSGRHRQTLERAAWKTAYRCRRYGIPPYFVTWSDLKLGKPGVTTHAECTRAFGGSHTDPGTGWPRWWFMRRVRYHHKRLWHVKRVA